MSYMFEQVGLGENLQSRAGTAFPGVSRTQQRPDIRQQPRTIEAIKFGLDSENFQQGEVFRAYPLVSSASCREVSKEAKFTGTFEDASMVATSDGTAYAIDLFRSKGIIPERMWMDAVTFEVVDVDGDEISVRIGFHVPRTMSQEGWLLVYRCEEEVFG